MINCRGCLINQLIYQLKFEGIENKQALPVILANLNRKKVNAEEEHGILSINEDAIIDVIDFCRDHFNTNQIFFKVEHQDWRPLADITMTIESQWIDQVISAANITPFYQPIVSTHKQLYAHEILARSFKQDGTMISPHTLFSSAKKRNRVYALDRLCRMTAVKSAVNLPNQKIFINFLPSSIYSPEFCLRSTLEMAKRVGVEPSHFVFEVVETEKIEDVDHLKSILHYYRDHGFQYALDDVGEGYNTVELLKELAPNYMKLDMKYVQGIAGNDAKRKMAQKLLEVAQQIQAIPLAEGIENETEFECLKGMGYQLFQGYWLGKPAAQPVGP